MHLHGHNTAHAQHLNIQCVRVDVQTKDNHEHTLHIPSCATVYITRQTLQLKFIKVQLEEIPGLQMTSG